MLLSCYDTFGCAPQPSDKFFQESLVLRRIVMEEIIWQIESKCRLATNEISYSHYSRLVAIEVLFPTFR